MLSVSESESESTPIELSVDDPAPWPVPGLTDLSDPMDLSSIFCFRIVVEDEVEDSVLESGV